MPWAFLTDNVVVSRPLIEDIINSRAMGTSFDSIADRRNKLLANK